MKKIIISVSHDKKAFIMNLVIKNSGPTKSKEDDMAIYIHVVGEKVNAALMSVQNTGRVEA